MNIYSNDPVGINEIVRFLENRAQAWSFSRLLAEVYKGEEPLVQRLSRKLTEYEGEKNAETVKRKVRNWIYDRNIPRSREELFRICFALGLDEEGAEAVLGVTAESGIHYRNPREVIYAFCLRSGIDYTEAAALAEELWPERPRKAESAAADRGTEALTGSIRNECKRIQTKEALAAFLEKNRDSFGNFHNTAYRKFVKMLKYLMAPEMSLQLDFPKEQEYSVERIVNEYLRMGVPYDKKSIRYSSVKKEIKKHWPSARSIGDMLNRKRDVDRKTLLLLYLATEGMGTVLPAESCSVREHYSKLNLMLTECGMPVLNPHTPFDYLILQAMNTGDEEESWGNRMEWMVRGIFRSDTAYVCAGERRK